MVGHAEHGLPDADVRNIVAQRVDGAGHNEADTARKIAGEEPSAESPIRGVEPAGMNPDPDLHGTGTRDGDVLQPQHVCGFAVFMESERLHDGATFAMGVSHRSVGLLGD